MRALMAAVTPSAAGAPFGPLTLTPKSSVGPAGLCEADMISAPNGLIARRPSGSASDARPWRMSAETAGVESSPSCTQQPPTTLIARSPHKTDGEYCTSVDI